MICHGIVTHSDGGMCYNSVSDPGFPASHKCREQICGASGDCGAGPAPGKAFPRSIRKPAKRLRIEEEEQGNGEQLLRQTEGLAQKRNEMEFAPTTRGCTGFDGGMEAGQAGGCA